MVSGDDDDLPVPSLPFTLPVRVQLRQSASATCWEATYSTPVYNDVALFRARSD